MEDEIDLLERIDLCKDRVGIKFEVFVFSFMFFLYLKFCFFWMKLLGKFENKNYIVI